MSSSLMPSKCDVAHSRYTENRLLLAQRSSGLTGSEEIRLPAPCASILLRVSLSHSCNEQSRFPIRNPPPPFSLSFNLSFLVFHFTSITACSSSITGESWPPLSAVLGNREGNEISPLLEKFSRSLPLSLLEVSSSSNLDSAALSTSFTQSLLRPCLFRRDRRASGTPVHRESRSVSTLR